MSKRPDQPIAQWHLAAALAGWMFPGLGHFLLGQRQRGVVLAVTIGLMWTWGLLLGGISVIDHTTHPAWFIGQMLVSPSVLVDEFHQRLDSQGKPEPRALPGDPEPAYVPSYSHVHEMGTLCTALAGLLNLLAIMDLIYRQPGDPRHEAAGASPAGGEA